MQSGALGEVIAARSRDSIREVLITMGGKPSRPLRARGYTMGSRTRQFPPAETRECYKLLVVLGGAYLPYEVEDGVTQASWSSMSSFKYQDNKQHIVLSNARYATAAPKAETRARRSRLVEHIPQLGNPAACSPAAKTSHQQPITHATPYQPKPSIRQA